MANASITMGNLAMPAVSGSGFVMIETEFGLRRLEAILNRPAMRLHGEQGLNGGSGRTPCREIGPFTVADGASDQQATVP